MKRKTNIFNLADSNDTNFLTFSNYTEYLTGNFVSTNTKLYPSTFLCMDLPFDEDHTLENFKYHLMCHYENKLACIRNYCIQNNQKCEDYIEPLGLLIESIHKFFEKTIDSNPIKICYISNIVEQDYKGTYTDSMCIINLNESSQVTNYVLKTGTEGNWTTVSSSNSNPTILEGWTENELSGLYTDNINAIYDNGTEYFLYSTIDHYEVSEPTIAQEISFNTIIPLFDIMNIEHVHGNTDVLYSLTQSDSKYHRLMNIPFGIWTNPESVKIARYNGFAQNWSLVIGSKFSPMPYGTIDKINDVYEFNHQTIDDVQKNNISDQYALTYAQLLYRQNELYNIYSQFTNKFNELTNTLENIQTKLNQIPITDNLNKVYEKIDQEVAAIREELNESENKINERIANLKWKQSKI